MTSTEPQQSDSAAVPGDNDNSSEATVDVAAAERIYERPGLLFRMIIPTTSIFIVTVLSLIAVLFSDQRSPVAQWLNKNGNQLLICEFVAVICLSVMAMTFDRWQTLKQQAAREQKPSDSDH